MTPLLLALPWVGMLLFVLFIARVPSELPSAAALQARDAPFVTVIVPARNETLNIMRCVTSLTASDYPAFEVIVVDDRSEDDTARLAGAAPVGNARRVRVIEGQELPEGWLGKPWACHQGAAAATGDLLLFTDADTTHGTALLSRAVAGLLEEEADLLTVFGRQLMLTFWERLVQPQIFLAMFFRFPDFERMAKSGRWRDAVANGQFMLFPRASYDALGGHEAVRDEVVEDLAFAQLVKRGGRALRIRAAKTDLATRMYRSLADLVQGWSKNLTMGGLQSVRPHLRPLVAPIAVFGGLGLWVAPPVALLVSIAGFWGSPLLLWAASVCGLSALTFGIFTRQMSAPAVYGLLYPLGALVGAYIFLRSWVRGRTVEWKGRTYTVPAASERA